MAGRRIIASLVDALAATALVFAGFRIGLAIAPCTELSDCASLAPIVILLVVAGVLLYFGPSQYVWRTTPGRRLPRVDE